MEGLNNFKTGEVSILLGEGGGGIYFGHTEKEFAMLEQVLCYQLSLFCGVLL